MIAVLTAAKGKVLNEREEIESFLASLPFSTTQTYGGQTCCVEIEQTRHHSKSDEYVLCDFGSGARALGTHVIARHGSKTPNVFHVFMSHLHWDHIMGFPHFAPAYHAGNKIFIYGCHPEMERAFRRQQNEISFPISFDALAADIHFIQLIPNESVHIAGLTVTPQLQFHTGDSYGYRFVANNGQILVYSTDSEHKLESPSETQRVVDFFSNADLVIFDSMYSFAETQSAKADFGHSSNLVGIELCQLAKVKQLAFYHHDPLFSDERISSIEIESKRLELLTRENNAALKIISTYDGLEIDL
ncbi:unnamed protein product [Rotaria magnacalcarata]|nr:unnamed protein product [Rotaria magnacalcarata]